jgi:hypothetical protein
MFEESTEAVAFVGTLSPKYVLECRIDGDAIDRRFAREEASLPLVVIV